MIKYLSHHSSRRFINQPPVTCLAIRASCIKPISQETPTLHQHVPCTFSSTLVTLIVTSLFIPRFKTLKPQQKTITHYSVDRYLGAYCIVGSHLPLNLSCPYVMKGIHFLWWFRAATVFKRSGINELLVSVCCHLR